MDEVDLGDFNVLLTRTAPLHIIRFFIYLLVIDKYICVSECQRVAGLSSGFVLDSQMSASSYEYYSYPGRGRINETFGMQIFTIN